MAEHFENSCECIFADQLHIVPTNVMLNKYDRRWLLFIWLLLVCNWKHYKIPNPKLNFIVCIWSDQLPASHSLQNKIEMKNKMKRKSDFDVGELLKNCKEKIWPSRKWSQRNIEKKEGKKCVPNFHRWLCFRIPWVIYIVKRFHRSVLSQQEKCSVRTPCRTHSHSKPTENCRQQFLFREKIHFDNK